VVGLDVNLITIAFIIWTFWNAFNDTFLGTLSDRTSTKYGRRKPYIIAGIYPLCIVTILLWTPPIGTSQLVIFAYFLIIISIWELFYTMYSVNQTSLFPEMFVNFEQRYKANTILQIFSIISLLVAFILPSFFIPKYDDPTYFKEYMYAGVAIAIVCSISATIFIKFGIKERIEFSKDPNSAPSFLKSLKFTFRNKAFRSYIIADFALFYAFGMLPIITPLYGSFVLGVNDSLILSLFLAIAFISAAIFVLVWRFIVLKWGVKNSFLLALISFIIILAPFMFLSDIFFAFIAYFFLGFGIAGAVYVRDITISAIIDEEEINKGIRREGGFYGVNGFIVKFANAAVIISIALVFNSVGWAIFNPKGTTQETILGLRSLIFIFPSIVLVIGIIGILQLPITKEKYEQITQQAKLLHEKKKGQITKN
jgi:GPH family glycoside/pentoside/hexuronide:cation symporter